MGTRAEDHRPSEFGIEQDLRRRNEYGMVGGGVFFDWSVKVNGRLIASGTEVSEAAARDAMKAAALAEAQRQIDSGWW